MTAKKHEREHREGTSLKTGSERPVYRRTYGHDWSVFLVPDMLWKRSSRREEQKKHTSPVEQGVELSPVQQSAESLDVRMLRLFSLSQEYAMTPMNLSTVKRSEHIASLAKLPKTAKDDDYIASLKKLMAGSAAEDEAPKTKNHEEIKAGKEKEYSEIIGKMDDLKFREELYTQLITDAGNGRADGTSAVRAITGLEAASKRKSLSAEQSSAISRKMDDPAFKETLFGQLLTDAGNGRADGTSAVRAITGLEAALKRKSLNPEQSAEISRKMNSLAFIKTLFGQLLTDAGPESNDPYSAVRAITGLEAVLKSKSLTAAESPDDSSEIKALIEKQSAEIMHKINDPAFKSKFYDQLLIDTYMASGVSAIRVVTEFEAALGIEYWNYDRLLDSEVRQRREQLKDTIFEMMKDSDLRNRYRAEISGERGIRSSTETTEKLKEIISLRVLREQLQTDRRKLRVSEFMSREDANGEPRSKTPGLTAVAFQALEDGIERVGKKEQVLIAALTDPQRGLLNTETLLGRKHELESKGFVMSPSREKLVSEIAELTAQGFRVFLGGPTGTGKTAAQMFALKEMTDGNYTVVSWTGETTLRDLFGGPILKITGKGPESSMSEGPVMQAMTGRVKGILHEEATSGQTGVQMSMKAIWATKPGEQIFLPNWNGQSFTKEQVIELATGNLKGKRHQERETMDPAVAREWKALEVPFMPSNETRDYLLMPELIDRSGLMVLSRKEIDMVDQFCRAAEISQRAHLEEITDDFKKGDLYKIIAPLGQNISLSSVFLDTGTVRDIFSGWRTSGKPLAEYLADGLTRFIDENPHFRESPAEKETMKKILKAYGFNLDKKYTDEFFKPSDDFINSDKRLYIKPTELDFLLSDQTPSSDNQFPGGIPPPPPIQTGQSMTPENPVILVENDYLTFFRSLESNLFEAKSKKNRTLDKTTRELVAEGNFKKNLKDLLTSLATRGQSSKATAWQAITSYNAALKSNVLITDELEEIDRTVKTEAFKENLLEYLKNEAEAGGNDDGYKAIRTIAGLNAALERGVFNETEAKDIIQKVAAPDFKNILNRDLLLHAEAGGVAREEQYRMNTWWMITGLEAGLKRGVLNESQARILIQKVSNPVFINNLRDFLLQEAEEGQKGTSTYSAVDAINPLGALSGLIEQFESKNPLDIFRRLETEVLSEKSENPGTEGKTTEELIKSQLFKDAIIAELPNIIAESRSDIKKIWPAIQKISAVYRMGFLDDEYISQFKTNISSVYGLRNIIIDDIKTKANAGLSNGNRASVALQEYYAGLSIDFFDEAERVELMKIFNEENFKTALKADLKQKFEYGISIERSARLAISGLEPALKLGIIDIRDSDEILQTISSAEYRSSLKKEVNSYAAGGQTTGSDAISAVSAINALTGLVEQLVPKDPFSFFRDLEQATLSTRSEKDPTRGKTIEELILTPKRKDELYEELLRDVELFPGRALGSKSYEIVTRLDAAMRRGLFSPDQKKEILDKISNDTFKTTLRTFLGKEADEGQAVGASVWRTITGLNAASRLGILEGNDEAEIMVLVNNPDLKSKLYNRLIDDAKLGWKNGMVGWWVVTGLEAVLERKVLTDTEIEAIIRKISDTKFKNSFSKEILNKGENGLSVEDSAWEAIMGINAISGLVEKFQPINPRELFLKLKDELLNAKVEQGDNAGKTTSGLVSSPEFTKTIKDNLFLSLDNIGRDMSKALTAMEHVRAAFRFGIIDVNEVIELKGKLSADGRREAIVSQITGMAESRIFDGNAATEAIRLIHAGLKIGFISPEEQETLMKSFSDGNFKSKLKKYFDQEIKAASQQSIMLLNIFDNLESALSLGILKREDIDFVTIKNYISSPDYLKTLKQDINGASEAGQTGYELAIPVIMKFNALSGLIEQFSPKTPAEFLRDLNRTVLKGKSEIQGTRGMTTEDLISTPDFSNQFYTQLVKDSDGGQGDGIKAYQAIKAYDAAMRRRFLNVIQVGVIFDKIKNPRFTAKLREFLLEKANAAQPDDPGSGYEAYQAITGFDAAYERGIVNGEEWREIIDKVTSGQLSKNLRNHLFRQAEDANEDNGYSGSNSAFHVVTGLAAADRRSILSNKDKEELLKKINTPKFTENLKKFFIAEAEYGQDTGGDYEQAARDTIIGLGALTPA